MEELKIHELETKNNDMDNYNFHLRTKWLKIWLKDYSLSAGNTGILSSSFLLDIYLFLPSSIFLEIILLYCQLLFPRNCECFAAAPSLQQPRLVFKQLKLS